MQTDDQFVLYRQWDTARVFYVSQTPGDGGADWGYSESPSEAKAVSRYWMRRFKIDCARVGQVGCCYVR